MFVADGGDFVATASYVVRPRGPRSWLDPGPFGTLGVGAGFALFLLSAGCAYAQGYYFSRPVNAEFATKLLCQGKIEFTRMPTPRLNVTAA